MVALWVRDILAQKHPQGQLAPADTLLGPGCCNHSCYDPILFDQLTGELIKWAAHSSRQQARGVAYWCW